MNEETSAHTHPGPSIRVPQPDRHTCPGSTPPSGRSSLLSSHWPHTIIALGPSSPCRHLLMPWVPFPLLQTMVMLASLYLVPPSTQSVTRELLRAQTSCSSLLPLSTDENPRFLPSVQGSFWIPTPLPTLTLQTSQSSSLLFLERTVLPSPVPVLTSGMLFLLPSSYASARGPVGESPLFL